jgi:hypothetical protein
MRIEDLEELREPLGNINILFSRGVKITIIPSHFAERSEDMIATFKSGDIVCMFVRKSIF